MCTLEKRGRVFLLTLRGDGEHRLNPNLLDDILAALNRVRAAPSGGSALITTAEGKFFSNGFDLKWADSATSAGSDTVVNRRHLMLGKFETLMASLLSLPFPTVAAISGHAAAAGFMLALSHDYIFMRKDRGFLYMSELDIGLTFPATLMTLIRSKIPVPSVRRDVILRATKFTARSAVEAGIIDKALENSSETLTAAFELGEELAGKNWDGKVYAENRWSAFPELAGMLGLLGENRTKIAGRL